MKNFFYIVAITCLISGFLITCSGSQAKYNLSNEPYSLLNSDSTAVNFPGDYRGNISVITFIYTHCPDMCTVITANMKNIQNELQNTSGINFIEISFDPERDKPSVLKDYKKLYELDQQFSMLTGKPPVIDSLLSRLDIKAKKTYPDSLDKSSKNYFMKHSNTIYLMDKNGKIRAEYPASVVPPENVIEDIQEMR